MRHHLVELDHVCSNYDAGAKNGAAPGFTSFYKGLNVEKDPYVPQMKGGGHNVFGEDHVGARLGSFPCIII